MIEEDTHLAGLSRLAEMHEVDRNGSRLELAQDDLQLARFDAVGDLIGQHLRYAEARDCCVDCRLRSRHREPRLYRDGQRRFRILPGEGPRIARPQSFEGYAGQPRQIGWRLRRAVSGQEGRAGAYDAMHVADMRGNQTAVRQRTDTNGDVDVIVDQVRIAIRQQQADIDRGKGREKFNDRRQHMQPAEYDGRRNNQIADGVGELAGGGTFGFADLF